jgi:hypothetical protein
LGVVVSSVTGVVTSPARNILQAPPCHTVFTSQPTMYTTRHIFTIHDAYRVHISHNIYIYIYIYIAVDLQYFSSGQARCWDF